MQKNLDIDDEVPKDSSIKDGKSDSDDSTIDSQIMIYNFFFDKG